MDDVRLRIIGVVRTPWRETGACPRNGRQLVPAPVCRVEVFAEFVEGLRDIEGFSHLILLYWLHRGRPLGDEHPMIVTPRRDGRPHGVFATRTPRRPNPVGLSVVRLDGRDGDSVLLVRNIDCVDGTPLLDIKPYIARTDAEPEARLGWLAETPSG